MDTNSLVIALLILIVVYLLLTSKSTKPVPEPQPVQIVYDVWPRHHYFGPYRRRFMHHRRRI